MTPAEQLASDVLQWSEYHPFVPNGTAGAYCGSRSPGYQSTCGRRDSEEVHRMTQAPTFTFNPPTASEMPEAITPPTPARLPYELRRIMGIKPDVRTVRGIVNGKRVETVVYTVYCKRKRCIERIACYRVVTGTHTVPTATFGLDVPATRTVEDDIYYWPDTAIVVETGTEYSRRVSQAGFCSMKCLSLWSAKIARDTE